MCTRKVLLKKEAFFIVGFIMITNINKNCVADKNSAVHCSKQPPEGTMLHYKHPTWKKDICVVCYKTINCKHKCIQFQKFNLKLKKAPHSTVKPVFPLSFESFDIYEHTCTQPPITSPSRSHLLFTPQGPK